jgi:acylglycerol lipase
MKHTDGYFNGIEHTRIFFQSWSPLHDPKANLLVVHGLAEHSGRYSNLVNHFVPLGYAVHGIDHIGHGKSSGHRAYVQRFRNYSATLKIFFDMIRGWQSDTPIFLVGHSMGGLMSALYLLDHQNELSGAVLSGPGIKVPDGISIALIFLGKILSLLAPKTGILQLDAGNISRDSAVVEAYLSDPLVYKGKISARLSAELLKTMQHVTENASKIILPILILQGGADKLVDPAGAQLLYDTVGSTDKTMHIYDGLYHEVLNEPEHERVLRDVETWLQQRTTGE